MKKTIAILMIFVCVLCLGTVYGATNEIISNKTKSELVEIKSKELKSVEDYNETYGNGYGIVAYVLNKIRIYSIPFGVLGIAVSAIYQYVIGIRHMESRDKGFNAMISIITLLVICQVLPLVFAIVVKGWRG
jgi:hypothetical protein